MDEEMIQAFADIIKLLAKTIEVKDESIQNLLDTIIDLNETISLLKEEHAVRSNEVPISKHQ